MKARSKYISLLLAVLMAITMSPLLSQEALAEKETHEVNMYNGVVCVDDNLTIDTTQYLDEDGDALVYAYYSTDGYKDFFNYRGPGTTIYSYQVPDMFSLGEQFYIVIENSYERIESEWITIKMNAPRTLLEEILPLAPVNMVSHNFPIVVMCCLKIFMKNYKKNLDIKNNFLIFVV